MNFLDKADKIVVKKKEEIDEWVKSKKLDTNPPFYTSVDLRVSNKKIVAVDTNIFPAGFNNLSNLFLKRAGEITKEYKKNK